MSVTIERQRTYDSRAVLHSYDFLCPFCYIAQDRNAILKRRGLDVIELPFEAHPDIPPGGIMPGSRKGRMYSMLEREARKAGLPLRWPHGERHGRCLLMQMTVRSFSISRSDAI